MTRAMNGGRGTCAWQMRSLRRTRGLVAIALGAFLAGCGGANEADVAQIVGGTGSSGTNPTPTLVATAGALGAVTGASQISFQAGAMIELEMFDELGRCLLNVTNEIVALVGDYRGRAVTTGTPVAFFVATGRGIIEGEADTDQTGIAQATFRSLCPSNARDPIVIISAVRGAEPFVDLNSNARYDAGEPFTDLDREAFLDANLDGLYQPELGEYLIWDPNNNGRYDAGGNGVYDVDNIIADGAIIIPMMKNSTPGTGTPGSGETPGTPGTPGTPTTTRTPETPVETSPTPTRTPSVIPAFLQVALFSNQASTNNDGTLSSVLSAQVSDEFGVALDGIPVVFRILPPVGAGVSVTSPSLSGDGPICQLSFTVPGQPGNALSCVKYDVVLQGQMITVEARVETPNGPLVSTQGILLPDIRPIPPVTLTPFPTPTQSITPTPKPVPKFLQLALYSNLVSQNSDGTFSTALTAVVGDKDGVALDNILVSFRLVPARAGVVVTSPGITGGPVPCVLMFPAPIPPPPPQPGDALTCVKYDSGLQGQTVILEASVETPDGPLLHTTSIVLPIAGPTSPERAASLVLADFVNRAADNSDGTFGTVVAALVSDSDGVALDGINVEFRQLPPVNPGVVITSPQLTGTGNPCDFDILINAKRGQALSCLKYSGSLGGQAVSIEARLKRASGDLVTSQTFVLPDFRIPTLSPTGTATATPPVPPSPTPSPTATATFQANSIVFVSANPSQIGVRESGKPEQSILTFRVTDAVGNPISNLAVVFQLAAIGGENLSSLGGRTDGEGLVQTVLTSGTRAAPVRVVAGVDVNGDGAPDVFAQSTQIAVFGGPPAENRFSVAAERRNVAGRRQFGIRNTISAFVNDRFGNAVPPGTAVSFVSNGASVVNPTATDEFGIATATLVTEGGIPPSGIVTVLAFTRGEEAFHDTNGDGVFQAGQDLIVDDNRPEPFISFRPLPPDLAGAGPDDSSCPILPASPVCRAGFLAQTQYDLFVDTDANRIWNVQGTPGVWDSNILLFKTIPITFSGTLVAPEVTLFPPGSPDPSSFHLVKGGAVTIRFTLHDDLRNPLVGGATITIEASRGKVTPSSITVPDGQSFNQIVPGLNEFEIVLSNSVDTTMVGEGMPTPTPVPGGPASVVVTITSENGNYTVILVTGSMD